MQDNDTIENESENEVMEGNQDDNKNPDEGGEKAETREDGDSVKQDGVSDGAERPEWISERIWNEKFAGKGEFNVEEAAKFYAEAYENAVKQLHTRKDTIRQSVEEEIKAEMAKNRPETAADYKVDAEAIEKELGMKFDFDESNPIMAKAKAMAFEKGLSNAEFNELVKFHVEGLIDSMPDWDVEKEKLGENADERLNYINTWAAKVLSPEAYKGFDSMPMTAERVIALEELMELTGSVKFTPENSGVPAGTGLTREQLLELQNSKEYLEGNPAVIQKVQAGWKKLVGNS